jgi:hypothetical protein
VRAAEFSIIFWQPMPRVFEPTMSTSKPRTTRSSTRDSAGLRATRRRSIRRRASPRKAARLRAHSATVAVRSPGPRDADRGRCTACTGARTARPMASPRRPCRVSTAAARSPAIASASFAALGVGGARGTRGGWWDESKSATPARRNPKRPPDCLCKRKIGVSEIESFLAGRWES